MKPITFNKLGRMLYHPDFHQRQNQHWTTHEQKFLLENYETLGPEEVSLTLERTIQSVMQKMTYLRKQGVAKPLNKRPKYHKRTMRDICCDGVNQ